MFGYMLRPRRPGHYKRLPEGLTRAAGIAHPLYLMSTFLALSVAVLVLVVAVTVRDSGSSEPCGKSKPPKWTVAERGSSRSHSVKNTCVEPGPSGSISTGASSDG